MSGRARRIRGSTQVLLAALAAGVVAGARPADATAQAQAPPSPVAITNARVHTVSGPVLEGATVLMRGGRIEAVGADVALPAGVRVLDGSGKVVTPGFLDSQTHVGAVEIDLIEATSDFASEDDRVTAAFDVRDGLNPRSSLIPVTRVEGVTRVVVAPEPGSSLVAGQGALIDLSGAPVDSIVARAPTAVYAALGEAGAELAGGSRGAATLRLREVLQDARDYAANRQAFEENRRRDYAVSRLDLEALVPVVRGQVPLAVTAHRASDLLAALRVAREFDLRLILLGAAEGWTVAGDIARAGVPVVLNPLHNIPAFEAAAATLENASRLHAAGVPVALGSFESHNARTLKQGAGNAVSHGLPHDAALAGVTLVPARIWEIDDRYGSIEPGKDADVVVWSGDPFELTTTVEHVFIRGWEMPKRTRQTELLEAYRTLPPRARPPREPTQPAAAAPGAPPSAAAEPAPPPGGVEPESAPGPEGPGQAPAAPGPPPSAPAPAEPAQPGAPAPPAGPSPPAEPRPPGEGPGTPEPGAPLDVLETGP